MGHGSQVSGNDDERPAIGATSNDESAVDPPPQSAPASTSSSGTISRRRALTILGAVPMAAAIGQVPRAPATPPPPSSDADAPQEATQQQRAPRFFNKHEWATLSMLVDYIIPRDDRSGSATDAKVPEYIDFLLAEKTANPAEQVAMRGGLAWVDTEMRRRVGKTFLLATDAQRRQLLDDIAYPDKAGPGMSYGVTFFNRLRDRTASGFFSSAMGWKDLRYIGNVFNPAYDGCPPAALERLGVSYEVMTTRIAPENT